MKQIKQHCIAALSMLGGGSLVFGLIFVMNAYSEPPPPEAKLESTAFEEKSGRLPSPGSSGGRRSAGR